MSGGKFPTYILDILIFSNFFLAAILLAIDCSDIFHSVLQNSTNWMVSAKSFNFFFGRYVNYWI